MALEKSDIKGIDFAKSQYAREVQKFKVKTKKFNQNSNKKQIKKQQSVEPEDEYPFPSYVS